MAVRLRLQYGTVTARLPYDKGGCTLPFCLPAVGVLARLSLPTVLCIFCVLHASVVEAAQVIYGCGSSNCGAVGCVLLLFPGALLYHWLYAFPPLVFPFYFFIFGLAC